MIIAKGYLFLLFFQVYNSGCMAQAAESFTTSDGETLFYSKSGLGQQIILLYGGPGLSADAMQHWADTLSDQYECILFHQRGTGLSENVKVDATTINLRRAVDDIEDLRLHLDKKKLTLCGYSWGGALAQAYTAVYPKQVSRLVLVSSLGPDLSLLTRFTQNIRSRTTKSMADSLQFWNNQPDSPETITKRMLYTFLPYFNHDAIGLKLLPKVQLLLNTDVSILMWADLRKNYHLSARLKRYKGKCYIIRPGQDVNPVGMALQIKEVLPQSELITIDQCGHFPDLECPQEFFGLLRSCL